MSRSRHCSWVYFGSSNGFSGTVSSSDRFFLVKSSIGEISAKTSRIPALGTRQTTVAALRSGWAWATLPAPVRTSGASTPFGEVTRHPAAAPFPGAVGFGDGKSLSHSLLLTTGKSRSPAGHAGGFCCWAAGRHATGRNEGKNDERLRRRRPLGPAGERKIPRLSLDVVRSIGVSQRFCQASAAPAAHATVRGTA